MNQIPIIAITMGDPAGIGPEIVLKALQEKEIYGTCKPLVLGDCKVLKKTCVDTGLNVILRKINVIKEAVYSMGIIDVIDYDNIDITNYYPGYVDAMNGRAAYDYLTGACFLALEGKVDAIVTAPVSKEAMWKAGYRYEGQTQILGELCKTKNINMMVINQKLKVVLLTRHKPLREALKDISEDIVFNTLNLLDNSFMKIGMTKPKIAVAGLNPHASESGIFGKEEEMHIIPAIIRAQNMGIIVEGPYPADTVFMRGAAGEFDVVLAMYHDQGMIPIKMAGFSKPYTFIIGLPIIRTSVGHGTAFDIAGKNKADHGSLIEAIIFAANLAERIKRKK